MKRTMKVKKVIEADGRIKYLNSIEVEEVVKLISAGAEIKDNVTVQVTIDDDNLLAVGKIKEITTAQEGK